MIANDSEYEITKEWIARFEEALLSIRGGSGDMNPTIRAFAIESMENWLEELRGDREEYERQREDSAGVAGAV